MEPSKENQNPTWWKLTADQVCQKLSTDHEKGLSQEEARERIEKYGKNKLPPPKKISVLSIFFSQFKNYIVWVLIVAAAIAFFLGEWVDAIAILAITIVNAVLGFFQEWKSIRSMEELTQVEHHYSSK